MTTDGSGEKTSGTLETGPLGLVTGVVEVTGPGNADQEPNNGPCSFNGIKCGGECWSFDSQAPFVKILTKKRVL